MILWLALLTVAVVLIPAAAWIYYRDDREGHGDAHVRYWSNLEDHRVRLESLENTREAEYAFDPIAEARGQARRRAGVLQ